MIHPIPHSIPNLHQTTDPVKTTWLTSRNIWAGAAVVAALAGAIFLRVRQAPVAVAKTFESNANVMMTHQALNTIVNANRPVVTPLPDFSKLVVPCSTHKTDMMELSKPSAGWLQSVSSVGWSVVEYCLRAIGQFFNYLFGK